MVLYNGMHFSSVRRAAAWTCMDISADCYTLEWYVLEWHCWPTGRQAGARVQHKSRIQLVGAVQQRRTMVKMDLDTCTMIVTASGGQVRDRQ
jgi:hypothetical protein